MPDNQSSKRPQQRAREAAETGQALSGGNRETVEPERGW